MTDADSILKLKKGGADAEAALTWIFTTYRNEFVWWAMKKYTCTEDDGVTLFEDAIIILVKNAKKDIFTLTAALKTYLIGIAINLKKEEFRKDNLEAERLKKIISTFPIHENPFITDDLDTVIKLLLAILATLGKPYKEVLTRFYLKGESLIQIKEAMNAASTTVVKMQKKRGLILMMDKLLHLRPTLHEGLGNPCKDLLTLYFIEKHKLKDIQDKMGFKSIEDLNDQIDKCLQTLLDRLL